jgi:hypothetical protein
MLMERQPWGWQRRLLPAGPELMSAAYVKLTSGLVNILLLSRSIEEAQTAFLSIQFLSRAACSFLFAPDVLLLVACSCRGIAGARTVERESTGGALA